jgi:hypothetical protein
MASITKLPSGAYRVQIRRKGRYASETFLRRDDAHRWARQAETRVDQGLAPNKSSVSRLQTFGDLIDLHITDMCEVGKPPRRSKAATLTTLKRDLGKEKIGHLDRQKLIDYGKMRAEQGAGPVTLGIDIGVIKMIITHAAAVHGLDISPEPVDLARVALKRLGLIGKGTERDRRPTTDELNRLFRCFDDNERLTLPMTRIVKFAVATAMRLDERRDMSGGYKVDVSRGTNVDRVSSEWFSRPDDERYLSLDDLFASVKGRADRERAIRDQHKVRYFRDAQLTARIQDPPIVEASAAISTAETNDWSSLQPIVPPQETEKSKPADDADGGIRREPEIPEHEDVAPELPFPREEFAALEDEPDDEAQRARAMQTRFRNVARQAALDPDDGIEL